MPRLESGNKVRIRHWGRNRHNFSASIFIKVLCHPLLYPKEKERILKPSCKRKKGLSLSNLTQKWDIDWERNPRLFRLRHSGAEISNSIQAADFQFCICLISTSHDIPTLYFRRCVTLHRIKSHLKFLLNSVWNAQKNSHDTTFPRLARTEKLTSAYWRNASMELH